MPVWVDGVTVRGYKVEQFADAFLRALGVSGVRSQSASQDGPNAANALNAHPSEGDPDAYPGRQPSLGDPLYPVVVAEGVRDEHITEGEAELAYSAHKLILLRRGEL
jgi:hypothetical protein